MVASLGGLDALVFTGGVGERSSEVRSEAVGRLGFLGIAPLHEAGEEQPAPDRVLSTPAAARRSWWSLHVRIFK